MKRKARLEDSTLLLCFYLSHALHHDGGVRSHHTCPLSAPCQWELFLSSALEQDYTPSTSCQYHSRDQASMLHRPEQQPACRLAKRSFAWASRIDNNCTLSLWKTIRPNASCWNHCRPLRNKALGNHVMQGHEHIGFGCTACPCNLDI